MLNGLIADWDCACCLARSLSLALACSLARSPLLSLALALALALTLALALPRSPVSRSFLAISRPVSHSRLNNPYTLTIFSSVLHSRRLRRCGLFFDCSIDVASSLQFNDVDSNFLSVALAPCSLLVQKFWLPVSHLTFSWAPEKRRLEQFLVASEAIESNRGKEQSTSMCKFDNSNDMKWCYQEKWEFVRVVEIHAIQTSLPSLSLVHVNLFSFVLQIILVWQRAPSSTSSANFVASSSLM